LSGYDTMKTSICKKDLRREEVRAKEKLNGLDYLEVSDNQLTLTVYFLGKAPQQISKDNFIIEAAGAYAISKSKKRR